MAVRQSLLTKTIALSLTSLYFPTISIYLRRNFPDFASFFSCDWQEVDLALVHPPLQHRRREYSLAENSLRRRPLIV